MKQDVFLNNFYSDYSIIESGVTQGSVLGPLLLHTYINDLEGNIISNGLTLGLTMENGILS